MQYYEPRVNGKDRIGLDDYGKPKFESYRQEVIAKKIANREKKGDYRV